MSGLNPLDFMRAMLVLKMGCSRWLEDYGGDTSGYVFKVVKENSQTPAGAAQEFCTRRLNPPLCGKKKEEKAKKEKAKEKQRADKRRELLMQEDKEEAKQKEKDPFSSLP